MSLNLRSAAVTTHVKFRNSVFGFIRAHEKNESIQVASIIKYLCLEYYLLKEEWTSCWSEHPHWIYEGGNHMNTSDWSQRTKFELYQFVGYKTDSGHHIQAEILRIKTNNDGEANQLFLKFAYNYNYIPYQWIDVPNKRLCAPHLIQPPHFDGIYGNLAVGAFDESIAEYRWSFKLWQSGPFTIGLRRQGQMVNNPQSLSTLYFEIASFSRDNRRIKKGDIFHLVLDLVEQSARVERGGKVLVNVPLFHDGSDMRYHNKMNWNPKSQYFVVIDHSDYAERFAKSLKILTDRKFNHQRSQRIVKFTDFGIKQKSPKFPSHGGADCVIF